MNKKEIIYMLLQKTPHTPISGEKIAQQLGISRTAVWKIIKQLQLEGISIQSLPKRGYQLVSTGVKIHSILLKEMLGEPFQHWKIETHDCVSSTNDLAKQYASSGTKQPKLIISNEQTAGRGRMGRTFYSPANSGLYLSFCLFPDQRRSSLALITSATAVAMAQAIEEVTSVPIDIKWVNDLFVKGKKVGGILTEMLFDMESQLPGSLIVGVGLNLTMPDIIPTELTSVMGSVQSDPLHSLDRHELVSLFLSHWLAYYHSLESAPFMEEYRKRSMIVGKTISITQNGTSYLAKAIQIDHLGQLIVEDEVGKIHTLSYGEVSIKPNTN